MNTILSETVVPAWIAAALGVATVAMFCGVLLLLARSKRANAQHDRTARDEKILRRLFVAALIPTLVVIGAVMGISFVGLSSFARHDMGWHSWISLIVPLSLDGISITFGFWAFVAVKRGRHPGRSERIVYVGALISAWINFNHGRAEWTGAAGIYLGFLSLASAWMFHELLTQFMDAQHTVPRARRNGIPMFGERWLWAPWSTLMARRAWAVHPPAPEVKPTAANALAHRAKVKALGHKDIKRLQHQAAVEAIARELGHTNTYTNSNHLAVPPYYVDTAETSIIPTTPVPTISQPSTVDTSSAVPATLLDSALTSVTTAPIGVSVPSPAEVAERITPRRTPSPATIPASVPGTAERSTRSRTSSPTTPAPRLTPSSTDLPVTATQAVQPPLPMVDPVLLAEATEVARQYHAEHGTRITAGQLAVRIHKDTKTAALLLQAIDDTPTANQTVNGTPVKASR
ncbi:MAG TPA: DUF2637 domain-containing protein [Candidatus Limnocylindrales bacterium]|nr:DUF2637 domain-containing protein [Candidatus Limnocylindrales bacterium]